MIRGSGLLLHLTSLPSPFGVGDMGPEAHRFLDLLARGGQRHWQMLPLGPTEPGLGNSPYSSYSAFAGHTLLISPDFLREDGLLSGQELDGARLPTTPHADFETATLARRGLLWRAFERAEAGLLDDAAFQRFLEDNAHWLNDFALFMAAKRRFNGAAWNLWPEDLRARREEALRHWGQELARDILFEKFCQRQFFRQWGRLKDRARELSVELVGDAPIYVTYDSADVWSRQELFRLDERGDPLVVAGVPPDYFSATGQRWGNPVYDWRTAEAQGFSWWIARLRHNFGLFGRVRLDHFRGFAAYWEIDAAEATAVRGKWVFAPGETLFSRLREEAGEIPIIAEDLGVITPDVVELKNSFGFPGMHILQFCFGPDLAHNPDAPHNQEQNSVVYVGTHDNNTARGWLRTDAGPGDKARLARYLGAEVREEDVSWALIRLAQSCPANTAIVTAQDLLSLDERGRMNTPGLANGNWSWRLLPGQLDESALSRLGELSAFYGRDGVEILRNDSYERSAAGLGAGAAWG